MKRFTLRPAPEIVVLAALLVLSLLGLVIIAATSGSSPLKCLVMMMFGLWLAFIGTDPLGGVERFTFGHFNLKSDIPLLPMLISVFAIPEIATVVMQNAKAKKLSALMGERLSRVEFRRCLRTKCRSTVIGTGIGIVPGLGQVVAAMMGYSAAKNASSHPETFGEGELEGAAAAEAASNAVNGATMVCPC